MRGQEGGRSYPIHDSVEGSEETAPGAQDAWKDYVARNIAHFSIRLKREPHFHVKARTRSNQGFMVTRLYTCSGRAELQRGPIEIELDGEDRYGFFAPLRGNQQLLHCNREAHCAPDSVTMVSLAEPLLQTKDGDNDTVYFYMPRQFVEAHIIWRGDICSRTKPADDGPWRLVYETIAALQRSATAMTDDQFTRASRNIGELAMLALDGCGDVYSSAQPLRSANIARAKRIIRAGLTDPDLTLTEIARKCGLSLRYLHDLFRDDGRTLSEYLQGERLKLAHSMLNSDDVRNGSITDIAMACGFSNPSHFSTAFKRAFGTSPRSIARSVHRTV
jgi:AraC-like DNA-binding protein